GVRKGSRHLIARPLIIDLTSLVLHAEPRRTLSRERSTRAIAFAVAVILPHFGTRLPLLGIGFAVIKTARAHRRGRDGVTSGDFGGCEMFLPVAPCLLKFANVRGRPAISSPGRRS